MLSKYEQFESDLKQLLYKYNYQIAPYSHGAVEIFLLGAGVNPLQSMVWVDNTDGE